MVEAGSLNDFFAANKKKTKKAKGSKAAGAAKKEQVDEAPKTTEATVVDEKQDQTLGQAKVKDTVKDTTEEKNTNAFEDSDEEAEANIVLKDELRSKLKDKKETDSKAASDPSKIDDGGWNLGGNKRLTEKKVEEDEKPSKKTGFEKISFSSRPPTFTQQSKTVVNKMEFPELGEMGKKDKQVLKKDMGYDAPSSAKPAASNAPKDDKPKMPMFFGKAKLNFDSGTTAEEVQSSKQNYDLSRFGMSQAATKDRKPGEQGNERRGERTGGDRGGKRGDGRFQAAAAAMDDDFEVVTDKKRVPKKQGGATFDNDFTTETKQARRGGRK